MKRYGEPLSCLMIDIDHFKKINDTYGHDSGDRVLKQLSKLLEEKARSYDMVSRWGGEEFLIICARSGPADSVPAGGAPTPDCGRAKDLSYRSGDKESDYQHRGGNLVS